MIERFATVYPLPRAVRFDGEAMRIFQGLGIVDEIEHDIVAADHYVWYGADGEIVDFDLTEPAPSGWSSAYSFWQRRRPGPEGAATRQDTSRLCAAGKRSRLSGRRPRRAQGRPRLRDAGRRVAGVGPERHHPFAISRRGGWRQLDGAHGIEIGVRDLGFAERWLRTYSLTIWSRGPRPRCRPSSVIRAGLRQGPQRRLLSALGIYAPTR